MMAVTLNAKQNSALARLRRQWLLVALACVVLLAAGAAVLHRLWQPSCAWRWAVLAGLVLVYQLWRLWRRLPDNRRPAERTLFPTLGLANLLSLLRGVLLAFLAGFIGSPWPEGWLAWAPGALYTSAIVIDYLDGWAARITGQTTLLGEVLDIEFDALGILVAPLLGVWYGQLPIWYLLVSLAYYLFVGGIGLRRRWGQPVADLPPSDIRRPLAGFQMGFISAVLWPVLQPPATFVAATLIMIPFVVAFLRDWLVVSQQIDPAGRRYQAITGTASLIATRWLPPLLRLVVLAIVVIQIVPVLASSTSGPDAGALGVLLLAAAVVTGTLGRLAAALLLIITGLAAVQSGLDPAGTVVLISTLLLMLFGTGTFSIWQPEEAWLLGRAGGRADGST